jgi:hypothetical protein
MNRPSKRELEQRGDRIAAAIKRNQANARIKDRAFPGRTINESVQHDAHVDSWFKHLMGGFFAVRS